jgi:hypothetical protein
LRKKTRNYVHDSIPSVVSKKSRDPCIKIVVPGAYVFNREIAILICSGPELVVLTISNKEGYDEFSSV